jgi:hypothetical protein
VDQDGTLRLACQPVDVSEAGTVGPVGVGRQLHVGRVDLDRAEAVLVEESLHLPGDVEGVPRVDSSDGHEPVAVPLDVAGDPWIHARREAHDLGGDRRDQSRPDDPLRVHRPEKLAGRALDPLDEVEVVPPFGQRPPGPFLELVVRADVDVGVEYRERR